MFWFWAFISMFGYALQNVLMTRYVRKIEVLSAGFYRNITFFVSFLPLLYFVPSDSYSMVHTFWPEIILACFLGAGSQWTRFLSLRYLPIGTSSAVVLGFNVLFSVLLGWVFFSEVLSFWVLVCIFITLAGSVILSTLKNDAPHLEPASVIKGFLLLLATSVMLTTAFFFVAKLSRELDPMLSAYVWESGIAVAALVFITGRKLFGGAGLERVSLKTFSKIFWCVLPTLLGTAGFALAITLGPLGIVSAISATGVFVITGLSILLYKETLTYRHYIAMGATIAGVVALRLLS